jgi:Protein of unknown function (DUF1460)
MTMNRRRFLHCARNAAAVVALHPTFIVDDAKSDGESRTIFSNLTDVAQSRGWEKLPMGECMVNMGLLLRETPYMGGTIEADFAHGEAEYCRAVLTGVDCVSFYETMLATARVLKKGIVSWNNLIEELTFMRYRGGTLNGYASRLHYTSDWFADNERKGVVRNITQEVGADGVAESLPVNVFFMSNNAKLYPALKAAPKLVSAIQQMEKRVNSEQHWFVPATSIALVAPKLKSGDIVGLVTSKAGLDYAHTGLVYRDEADEARFLHASLSRKKVILDSTITDYVASVKTHRGITIVRPVEIA